MLRLLKSLWSLASLFLIFHSFTSSSSIRAPCPPEERTALQNLNCSSTQIPPFFNMTGDCCSWPSVECDSETGHVTFLLAEGCFPNGRITFQSSLFSLRHLQTLILSGFSEMSSDVFDAMTQNLTRLQDLRLFEINMSLVPPASLLKSLSSLKSLVIGSCQLSGEFGNNSFHFPNLTKIYLPENKLRGPIPPWICGLPNLEKLDLDDNLFSGEICEFQSPSLNLLNLRNNKLQGAVPRSLFQKMNLTTLNLSSNNLTGIVELQVLSKLKKLGYLNLSHNNLSLTNNCTNCTFENLSDVRLSSCNLAEFPNFLSSLKVLLNLDLSNNQIRGIVPKWLEEREGLYMLDLSSNFFFGPLPKFPPHLVYIFASRNHFSGEIPASFCNTTSLVMLDLSHNNLSGRIPPCLGNSIYLSVLDLQRNKLHGEIPESLFVNTSYLQSLNLKGNQLEGQLPKSLVTCTELEVLDLGNNQFTDTFPGWLDSFPQLQVLVLTGNKFHGLVGNPNPKFPFQQNPKPIFPFQKLRIMDLSHNDFTGALPTKYFDNFKAMKTDAHHAELSYMGKRDFFSDYYDSVTITMKGSEFSLERIQTIFTTIDLSCNSFTGEIPELLGNLISLKGLNLSHNMLTGILPPSLGNLTNLEWLDLSSNEVVGKIPDELADINGLAFFNVSHNHLEGPIPLGKQFNTFPIESYEGNLNLCGPPLSKSCGGDTKLPLEPSLEQDDDATNWFNWRIVMMGFASGLVIGLSIGYILLYSNGKLHWLSERMVEKIEYRRAIRPKRGNARRSVTK